MLGFQLLQLLHELVEIPITDLGLVEHVVQVFVMADFLAQGFDLFFGVLSCRHRRKDYRRGKHPRGGCSPCLASEADLCHIQGRVLPSEGWDMSNAGKSGTKKLSGPYINQLPQALLNAFDTNDRINHYLIENLPAEAWSAKPADGKARTIAAIVAHMHNVRVMWLKATKANDIPAQLNRATVTPAQAVKGMTSSREALHA